MIVFIIVVFAPADAMNFSYDVKLFRPNSAQCPSPMSPNSINIGRTCLSGIAKRERIKICNEVSYNQWLPIKSICPDDVKVVFKKSDISEGHIDKSGAYFVPEGVTRIEERCFANRKDILALILSSTVREVGKQALYNSSITSISGLKEVKRIGDLYFNTSIWNKPDNIRILAPVLNFQLRGTVLPKRIYLPEGVWKIGDCCFYDCKTMQYISLPKSLSEIGMMAFACSGLKEIELSEYVKTVGKWCFQGCEGIKISHVSLID